MPRHATLAAIVLIAWATAAPAQETPACRDACAPALRECLQQGRPELRQCLRDCRDAAGDSCPEGVDIEDCAGASGLQACVARCRDSRRQEIRRCVRRGTECGGHCRRSTGPTPTPTPRRGG